MTIRKRKNEDMAKKFGILKYSLLNWQRTAVIFYKCFRWESRGTEDNRLWQDGKSSKKIRALKNLKAYSKN